MQVELYRQLISNFNQALCFINERKSLSQDETKLVAKIKSSIQILEDSVVFSSVTTKE